MCVWFFEQPVRSSSQFNTHNNLLDMLVTISSPNAVRNGDTSDTGRCGLVNVHLTQKSLPRLVS